MSEYLAPLKDMQFMLREVAPLGSLTSLTDYAEINLKLAEAALAIAGDLL
jgi:hypothetical protein